MCVFIYYTDVPPKPVMMEEHSYAKHQSSSTTTHCPKPGYTTLATKGSDDFVGALDETDSWTLPVGCSVQLLSLDGTVVGTASTMAGNQLHGRTIPAGYTRISVQWINRDVRPLIECPFDDDCLAVGVITAWPSSKLKTLTV